MQCLTILNEQILHEEGATASNMTCMSGSGDHQHCGLAGTGRVWGGSWVIPITHITLQHYIHCTPHTGHWSGGQVRRRRDKNKIDFTQKRVILKYKLDYQSLAARPSQ